MVNYARALFPESQRKNDPESEKDVPLGDDIMGMYVDIHAEGGYVCEYVGSRDTSCICTLCKIVTESHFIVLSLKRLSMGT